MKFFWVAIFSSQCKTIESKPLSKMVSWTRYRVEAHWTWWY